MLLFDRLAISSQRRYTDEGFLTVPAKIARTGIQDYSAASMGLSDRDPNEVIKVYRPAEEVFSEDSLASFYNKPVTNDHPPELVTADNVRRYSVGHSGEDIVQDGNFVKATITVTDGRAVKLIKDGKVELSNGYVADIDWTAGVTPDGIQYDAVQRNIRGNHIAIVEKGRAGPECKVADSKSTKDTPMAKVLIDGVEYEVTEQISQAVGKLQTQLKDAEEMAEKSKKDKEKSDEEKEAEMKAKDEAVAAKDAAEAKVTTPEQLDKLVADRAEFVASCKKIVADFDCSGKTEAVCKAEVVAAKCAGVQLDSVSEDYVAARFDILLEDSAAAPAAKSPVAAALQSQVAADSTKVEDTRSPSMIARDEMIKRNQSAWKGA